MRRETTNIRNNTNYTCITSCNCNILSLCVAQIKHLNLKRNLHKANFYISRVLQDVLQFYAKGPIEKSRYSCRLSIYDCEWYDTKCFLLASLFSSGPKSHASGVYSFYLVLSVYAARLNAPETLLHNQTASRGEQNAFPSKTRATNRRKRDLFL